MRKVPFKNYIIAIIIMVITILATLISANLYRDSADIKNKNYLNTFQEIKIDEIDNYIVETHDVMIYMTDRELSNKKIDRDFESIITKNDKKEYVVFLNLFGLDDTELNELAKKYNINKELLKSNTLVFFKEGKASRIINFTEKSVKLTNEYISNYYGE